MENFTYVIGYAGGENGLEVHICSKCGQELRGDHGYKLNTGDYICRSGDKCSMRRTSGQAALTDSPMRWRK